MTLRLSRDEMVAGAIAAALAAIGLLGPLAPISTELIGVAVLIAGAWAVWHVHPAWTLSLALMLSVVAGNWEHLGIPGIVAPDRLLLAGGVAAVLFRAPPIRDRPRIEFRAVHWAMLLTLLWMAGSALAAGTLSDRGEVFELLERLGVLPFLLFLVAPVVFDTEERRRILLGALVALGGYLGFTALMEAVGIRGLVFPSFINDPSIGTHADRSRGPFLEAVTNGAGLYAGLVGAAVALVLWRSERARRVATVVLLLCAAGLLFTETRSVWLGGFAATIIALLAARELRVWFVPAVAAGAVVLTISLAVVPGLAAAVGERSSDESTVWDRKNLSTAATNMVDRYPLTGIGWGRFTEEGDDYFRQAQDYPLTATDEIVHNVYLTYAAETGLIGVALWFASVALGAAAALRPSRDPEARLWQIAFGSYLVFYVVISTFVFAQVFPTNMLWLLAGVAVGAVGTGAAQRTPGPRAA